MRTVLLVLALAALAAVPAAAAPEARSCANVPAAHVSNVVAQGVACAPARTVARRWAAWARRAAHPSRPHVVTGYLCRERAHAVRCSTKTALIRFTWRR
jgi:hypothetical protein